jgi:hypothetical protein
MAVDDFLMKKWAFIASHGLVLLLIAKHPKCKRAVKFRSAYYRENGLWNPERFGRRRIY